MIQYYNDRMNLDFASIKEYWWLYAIMILAVIIFKIWKKRGEK